MNPIQVAFFSKVVTNKEYDLTDPNSKLSERRICSGGCAATAVPVLQRLNVPTAVFATVSKSKRDRQHRRRLESFGAVCQFEEVSEVGTTNAICLIDGDLSEVDRSEKILRVVPGPEPRLTKSQADELLKLRPRRFALGGSNPDALHDMVFDIAANTGPQVFWNPSGSADLESAKDRGFAHFTLQVSFAEWSEKLGVDDPKEMCEELFNLFGPGATIVVTDAENGIWAADREGRVIFVPAIPVDDDAIAKTTGAGDSVFGFVVATPEVPLKRRLQGAVLVAARHLQGLPSTDWHGLELFERSVTQPAIAKAA